MTEFTQRLYDCNSRLEAATLLEGWSKKRLLQYAKELDVYVTSKDNIERIKEQIIAFTTGSKLRHEAIMAIKLR